MNVLELFSGIGGMHLALKASGCPGEIKTSIDINPVANCIYSHNFPNVPLVNGNIQGLSVKFIDQLGVDTILMSPPCQPFIRNGLQADIDDDRTDAFKYILRLLPELNGIKRILIENVKGFESSQMRNLLIDTLHKCNFNFQEFILSPTQFGVPNTRHRYYCIAKKQPLMFNFDTGELKTAMPTSNSYNIKTISEYIDQSSNIDKFFLNDKILTKYLYLLDICYGNSTNSCCFTKAYSRFVEGTGSVFTSKNKSVTDAIFEEMQKIDDKSSGEYLELARSLQLRFFTPEEVCRLMSFPGTFQFPREITNRQKYMVLGNSINITVVAELIKLLL